MKTSYISNVLYALALGATTASAGLFSDTFTLRADDGTVIGAKDHNPTHPNAEARCFNVLKGTEGVSRVDVSRATFGGNDEYCIIGFKENACNSEPDITKIWPPVDADGKVDEEARKNGYEFKTDGLELAKAVTVVEGACIDVDILKYSYK